MTKSLQSLIDAPLADPVNIYLPEGKRRKPRSPRPVYENDIDCPKLTGAQLQDRAKKALSKKHDAMLAYYATTDLSNERIAEHLGLSVERIEREMLWRRREQ